MSRRTAAVCFQLATLAVFGLCCCAIAAGQDDKSTPSQRQWTVYLLPHSHNDIGYTHLQPEVERKQWANIDTALDLIRKTADYPPGARFKWNTEVLWAVDSYLREQPPEKQQRLIDAIRAGQVELDALYCNELTGLCRPEELLRLCDCAQRLAKRCGVKIETAMISDVPGYTWGIVPALAQAGVKYFSIGPNGSDRIGRTLSTWTDKPFYWVAPDGRQKVLCWVPYLGYGLSHTKYKLDPRVLERVGELEKAGYPYDMVQERWSGNGDNASPDVTLPDVVKNWNLKHANPKMVIATASEVFREFEKRYGEKLPSFRGDWTPYWEDGAASSARETALNRNAAERLVQAEALWAMLDPAHYPVERFSAAWRNAVLYDEHTWGAWNSIYSPDKQFVKDQWKIKQAFALDADEMSGTLLSAQKIRFVEKEPADAVDVYNTCSWPRTQLIVLPAGYCGWWGARRSAWNHIVGPDGEKIAPQILSTGEAAFLAKSVPPFSARSYSLKAGAIAPTGKATAVGTVLHTSTLTVRVDPATGDIASLDSAAVEADLCDREGALNSYRYVLDAKTKEPREPGPARITVKESGPLVASLLVESDAPGCAKLAREYRVVAGLDRVDIIDTIDKKPVRQKEAVHLGFAFNVPGGVMRMDIPWAVIRPEIDQLPGACKNWFSVGRWVDISNSDYGVTWATLDAPMVEVGAIAPDNFKPGNHLDSWIEHLEPSQTLYSYVMNNHWFTNYRAEQSGPTTFRYSLRPHKEYDPIAAQRFGIECSQPLVVLLPARDKVPEGKSFLTVDTPDVIVASIKPSADHKAYIVRLFGAAGRPVRAGLSWGGTPPKAVYLSNLAEERGARWTGPIPVPAWGLVTLRAEM